MLQQPGDVGDQVRRVKAVEHEGDQITHRAIEMLHQTFITTP